MSEVIINIFIGSSTTTVISLIIFKYILDHQREFEHWTVIFYQKLHDTIPIIRSKVDPYMVASSIQDSVNGIFEDLNREAPDVLPHPLKIKWVKSESPEAFIENGEAIVRLKHYVNQDRNIVDATLLYLNKGLLPQAKVYLDKTLHKSCEYKVATKVFAARRDTGAFAYFIEHELNPAINTDADFKHDLQILENLDSVGFFTRVFLTEVKQAGEKLLGTMPTPAIQQELRNFAEFLQTIATKGPTEEVPLTFKGVRVKVAVVLVAKKETIDSYGIVPYIRRISRSVREGYESIYITGWGEDFVKSIIEIKKDVEGKIVTILRRYDYPIREREQTKAILLVCQSNLSYLAQRRELQDEVKQAMAEIIPEIKSGEIEIVSIARERGICCKIAVRSVLTRDIVDTLSACKGKNNERLDELKLRLPNELLEVVPWSDDIKNFIVNALYPLKGQDVNSVDIDEENSMATVEVSNAGAYNKALGRDYYNVKLARELTGWYIDIKRLRQPENISRAEDDLRNIITDHVPEIKNNEIEIVRLARLEGKGSKVIVKSNNEDMKFPASRICCGLYGDRLRAISHEMNNERLYFHDWSDDPEELIISCLYPLTRFDMVSTDLDYKKNKAIITIKAGKKASQFFRNRYYLNLAERVTGWSIEIRKT